MTNKARLEADPALRQREYDAAKAKRRGPEGDAIRAREAVSLRRRYAADPERFRAYCRAYYNRQKLRTNRKSGDDLFSQLSKLCARDFNKDDIIPEAFIFVMEGMEPKDAVAKARKKANKFSNELRFNTVDIHDESKTFWLGEPADFSDNEDDI